MRSCERFSRGRAMHLGSEGHRVFDGEPGVERCVAVLEHHLDLATEGLHRHLGRTDLAAVKNDFAGGGADEIHQQTRGRAFAATRLSDDAKRLASKHAEINAIHRADHRAFCTNRRSKWKVFDQAANLEQRRGGAWTGKVSVHDQFFTSMAERSESDSRLNAIEVMKIIAPGNAATQGCV